MSTGAVYDFGAIRERLGELGIKPVYGEHPVAAPAKAAETICPSLGPCLVPCATTPNCRIRANQVST